jgi:hypothetical protein
MHIHALSQKALFSPDKQSVQQEMRNICALNPKPDDLWPKLSTCECFPVRKPSGEVEWLSCSGAFAVVDRIDYGNLFRDKIATLDFSLEDVHCLKVFIHGLKLEPKYLSNAVTEETRVEGGILNAELTNDLRRKAYAIARYVPFYGKELNGYVLTYPDTLGILGFQMPLSRIPFSRTWKSILATAYRMFCLLL